MCMLHAYAHIGAYVVWKSWKIRCFILLPLAFSQFTFSHSHILYFVFYYYSYFVLVVLFTCSNVISKFVIVHTCKSWKER